MASGTYDITIEKRASFAFTARLKNCDGTPYNLTNKTLRAQIRRKFDEVLQAEFSIQETDSINGIVVVSLTKEQTAGLVEAESCYDIFADYDNGGGSDKVLQGNVTIIRNCTEL